MDAKSVLPGIRTVRAVRCKVCANTGNSRVKPYPKPNKQIEKDYNYEKIIPADFINPASPAGSNLFLPHPGRAAESTDFSDLGIAKIYTRLYSYYDIDDSVLQAQDIESLAAALAKIDPYSRYLTAEQFTALNESYEPIIYRHRRSSGNEC